MERIFIFTPSTQPLLFFTSLLKIQEIRFNRIYLVQISYVKKNKYRKVNSLWRISKASRVFFGAFLWV